ncbi:hypothetical protein ONS95_002814 [Cadophora gregata]|uniref:uncharacterized protein n=1 Tax=Cadophora gregata TaxID=51156 RepID=UPI0026DB83B8|nr:uncharacterized protein ONS95_002814 [Cadophora gregata]KAK0110163.1 hypothetical protein ONS95_002814 [Cadophora gregata]KAK0110222.1 hypothetical protein ONS96_001845 [Cadophora gregata f. sp. sojae]
MRRIEPFLRGLEKYSKVIEVICNYLPYVWAPIKLMLQLASHHRDVFESLLDAYKEIGDSLPRFDRYEQAFKDNPAFLAVLASVYSSILDFHQRAYKFFKRRAWHVLFQSLWKDFGARFAGIINGLKKQRDFVDREAVSIDLVESKESRIRAQEEIEQRQKSSLLLIEQNEAILSALQFQQSVAWFSIDEIAQGNRYEQLCQRRHDETCSWVLNHPELKSWMGSTAENQFVWLSGKPGAGKSVMSSSIVSKLLESQSVDTLYYFCSSKDDSCNLILRSLAMQLLRQHPDLASLISKEFFRKTCNAAQIRDLFPRILATSACSRIILDGVDETAHEIQKLILREIQAVCSTTTGNCKILFSSRKEVGLAKQLAKKTSIVLDGREEVKLDIESFVRYKMEQVKTSNTMLRQEIESDLIRNADGMFLWVHLVVEGLKGCYSDWDLERNTRCLPKGLEAAYERILDRIQLDPAAAIAINILEWMACSHRPLRIYELLDGISFRPDHPTFDSRPKMDIAVLDLCRPLIEIGPSCVLDFVHFSAKEFILKNGTRDRNPFVTITEANLNISFACVAYLNTAFPLLPNRGNEAQQAAIVATGFHGLLPYANQYWIDHLLAFCRSTGKQVPRAIVDQLSGLIDYLKPTGVARSQAGNLTATINIDGLEFLDQFPQIQSIISNIKCFKNELDEASDLDMSETSVKDTAHQECDTDPTFFTALRHNYQSILESLLDPNSWWLFPNIDRRTLSSFLETFSSRAFTCRYSQCARAVDGFDTSKQRDAHEAAHTRQFRCNFPRCINFSTGFTKRSALNRHNKQYHQVLDQPASSLSELISSIRYVPPVASDEQTRALPSEAQLFLLQHQRQAQAQAQIASQQRQKQREAESQMGAQLTPRQYQQQRPRQQRMLRAQAQAQQQHPMVLQLSRRQQAEVPPPTSMRKRTASDMSHANAGAKSQIQEPDAGPDLRQEASDVPSAPNAIETKKILETARTEVTARTSFSALSAHDEDLAIRRKIIHILAVQALATDSVREKLLELNCNPSALVTRLQKVGFRRGNLWELYWHAWKELDVWEYDYDWYEDCQQAIDNAVTMYDFMELGSSEPEWERLLSPDQRGKGICLSELAPRNNMSAEEKDQSSIDYHLSHTSPLTQSDWIGQLDASSTNGATSVVDDSDNVLPNSDLANASSTQNHEPLDDQKVAPIRSLSNLASPACSLSDFDFDLPDKVLEDWDFPAGTSSPAYGQ